MHFRQNAIFALSSTFRIQPTISQFKIVQNFFERYHSKAPFSCFRLLYIFYHGKYSIADGPSSIYKSIAVDAYIVEGGR